MSAKQRLKEKLLTVARLRDTGQFAAANAMLQSIETDSDIDLLGARTSLGLPRQLHSAFLKLAKAKGDQKLKIAYQYHLVPPPTLLSSVRRFTLEERMRVTASNRERTPRIIHQIWIGEADTPPSTSAWREHAYRHEYDYQLWDDNALKQIGVTDHPVYQFMVEKGDFPGAVDIARYYILELHGGVYLDCDWYPARDDVSFHDVLPLLGLTAMPEPIPRNMGTDGLLLANSFIAGPPAHPAFSRIIKAVDESHKLLPDEPAWWVTGPYLFSLVARAGSLSLADSALVESSLPQETSLKAIDQWRHRAPDDRGLLLAWKSWIWR